VTVAPGVGVAHDLLSVAAVFRWAGLDPDPWQAEVMDWWPTTTENLAYVAPRRVGKDATACAIAAHAMAFVAGFEAFVAGPTESHALEDVRTVRGYLQAFPDHLRPRFVADSKTGLELANGSRLRIGTANPASARGVGADLVILTEAAYLTDALIAAVLPVVVQRHGRFLACSTPSRGESWFRQLFDDPLGTGRGWRTRRITPDDTPRFTERMREMARASMTEEAFRREFEGLWSDGDDGFEVALGEFPLAAGPVDAAALVADDWAAILRDRGYR